MRPLCISGDFERDELRALVLRFALRGRHPHPTQPPTEPLALRHSPQREAYEDEHRRNQPDVVAPIPRSNSDPL